MKVLFMVGIALLGVIAAFIEVVVYIQDPWQLLNPYVQFVMVGYFFRLPFVWIILPLTVLFGIINYRRNR